MQNSATVGSNFMPPPKRETLRELMQRWRTAAQPSSQGGDEETREALLFGGINGGGQSTRPLSTSVVTFVAAAEDPWSILGGGSTSTLTGVKKATLLEVVQRQRQSSTRTLSRRGTANVTTEEQGDDVIEDVVEPDARQQQDAKPTTTTATARMSTLAGQPKKRTVEDMMDSWSVPCRNHRDDDADLTRQARQHKSTSNQKHSSASILDLAKPTVRDITHLLPLTNAVECGQKSDTGLPDMLTSATTKQGDSNHRNQKTMKASSDVFAKLDALVDDNGRGSGGGSSGGTRQRLDHIVDAECPFGEQALMFASSAAAGTAEGGAGRRSGRVGGGSGHNFTSAEVMDRLNTSFDSWKRQVAGQVSMSHDVRHCLALVLRIDRLDAAFGIVSLVGRMMHVSPALRASVEASMKSSKLALEIQEEWDGEQVVVVVDQSVYRNLGVLVGNEIVIGNPCYATGPTVGSMGLPIVIASFCIAAATAEFLQPRRDIDGGSLGDQLRQIAAPFRYDPLEQRHASGEGIQLVGQLPEGGVDIVHDKEVREGKRAPTTGTTSSASTTGIPRGPVGMDWHVPVDIIMQLVYRRQQQQQELLENEGDDDDHQDELFGSVDDTCHTNQRVLPGPVPIVAPSPSHYSSDHPQANDERDVVRMSYPFQDHAQSTLSEDDFDDGFG
ncbi:Hypothetical protein, putative [Bodo saltans]|uniref:Uncharacterized protein n=1 Tax=Bodo saltans TaxID=75058 RepID=A0A0S4KIW6_BODSA|nr:Hypothetical protein, putative [Bodo saltans]|eukprot:CUI15576.1 Hypothetical protein, putative [Bodo saltans]